IQQVIYDQEESKYAIPRGLFDIGLGMCIPTICTWGTQEHRDRFARKALRGEEVWCQLFSEPAAGSDLAGLRTRAERDGDHWVVGVEDIFELARKVELDDGPALKNEAVRDKLADWYVTSQGLKYSHFRTMTALSRGDTPGPESSIGKLVNGSKLQNIAAFAMDLMEQGGILTDPELAPLAAVFQQTLMTSPSSRIA